MALGTLDGTPPPIFKQGPSALSRLAFFSALAVLLMAADVRWHLAQPVRAAVAAVLYPVQWLVLQPIHAVGLAGGYLEILSATQAREAQAQYRLGLQSQRAQQVEQLQLENTRLRALLALKERPSTPALAAQVLYDAADPYSRTVVIDKGAWAAVQQGAPVLDESGVLGQVTRVYPATSEVTLLVDRSQSIPVLNARSGVRGVAFGDPTGLGLELRFMGAHVDVQEGDLLTTSGIDGIYPPGLAVARVAQVERRADSSFARIRCTPVAQMNASLHVLVLKPVQPIAASGQAAPEPAPAASAAPPAAAGKASATDGGRP